MCSQVNPSNKSKFKCGSSFYFDTRMRTVRLVDLLVNKLAIDCNLPSEFGIN